MTTYQYRCSMKHTWEREFPFGQAKPHIRCPICRNKAQKIITPPAYIIAEKWADKRENRLTPVGHSMRDALELSKAADKRYDRSYEGAPERAQERAEAEHKAMKLDQLGIKAPEVVMPKDVKWRKPTVR
jgi:hypothetical protein